MNFNPRTREGCDWIIIIKHKRLQISIHAPARGATDLILLCGCFISGFQSTHPRGVRQIKTHRYAYIQYFNPRTREGCDKSGHTYVQPDSDFNPRTREGCDPTQLVGMSPTNVISIHAPARGATCSVQFFQTHQSFQSTHPRGVRLYFKSCLICTNDFNPRTREGCDL